MPAINGCLNSVSNSGTLIVWFWVVNATRHLIPDAEVFETGSDHAPGALDRSTYRVWTPCSSAQVRPAASAASDVA